MSQASVQAVVMLKMCQLFLLFSVCFMDLQFPEVVYYLNLCKVVVLHSSVYSTTGRGIG